MPPLLSGRNRPRENGQLVPCGHWWLESAEGANLETRRDDQRADHATLRPHYRYHGKDSIPLLPKVDRDVRVKAALQQLQDRY